MENTAEAAAGDQAMSGWRSDLMAATAQVQRQRSRLLGLVGQRLRAGWTGWDPARDVWQPHIPLVLVFDGGGALELAWQSWGALSITWNTIDLGIPPVIAGRPHEWRSSQPRPLAAVAGRTLTGWALTESPHFRGDADLTGELPMDEVVGWSTQGLWIEFGDTGLHVYNGADANGVRAEPMRPGDDGHTRLTHRQLPDC